MQCNAMRFALQRHLENDAHDRKDITIWLRKYMLVICGRSRRRCSYCPVHFRQVFYWEKSVEQCNATKIEAALSLRANTDVGEGEEFCPKNGPLWHPRREDAMLLPSTIKLVNHNTIGKTKPKPTTL